MNLRSRACANTPVPASSYLRLLTSRQSRSAIPSSTIPEQNESPYALDSNAGLDYADQRFYASQFGRFMSADRYQATTDGENDPSNPTSWNKYTYSLGDAVNYYDPTGQFACCQPGYVTGSDGKSCVPNDCPPGTVYYNGQCVAALNDGAGKGLLNGGGPSYGGSAGTSSSPLDPTQKQPLPPTVSNRVSRAIWGYRLPPLRR